ncbi:glycerol-3-phosphate dehydrogenase/oxidase [Agrobacterium tumefaciens]|uniref:Glycerol-3-phosphate dehydrogenase/oxidase n=1 Tax=Agrobacterium tumefaciens TaxID=358 RepID=A0A4D7Z2L7_AGRTU|nr:glycerol-3-phosphate dehydrogenase/oxidase [Agrobacterium tumefaciens]QCL98162.1 glycerol-3-phosphate dehydrogenase/oxidase [Agrobacterium tumefaciens]
MSSSGTNTVTANSRLRAVAHHYPVVIIGGGINGCGLFRDLAAQGIDCLLVDKGDFCSGASAAPSRLIHGGIKYLETGEFRLVRQSAMERNLLLKNAPHYVKPLETVLPVYSWFGGIVPSIRRFFRLKATLNDRGAIITELGLWMYDLFGRHVRTMPNHRLRLKKRMLGLMPELTKKIVAAGIYYEARITHAERLGLELLLDGKADNPAAVALNHVSVTGSRIGGVLLRDELSGECTSVTADIVINAGGAWIDLVNKSLGIDSHHMGGNKGSHLIVRNKRLYEALDGRMIYFGSADGRVNLLYPFMGNVLVGSTDIPITNPDLAICDDEEKRYLANVTREVFPDIAIEPSQIFMTYCGVRPLPRSEGLDPGAVSRDHSIAKDELPDSRTPVYSLIGGKWTTYRGFSEEACDLVLRELTRPRRCSTREMAIGGGRDFPTDAAAHACLVREISATTPSQEAAQRLIDRYGTRARLVASSTANSIHQPLHSLPRYGREELAWICRNESVGRLTDLLFRRTDIALSGDLSLTVITEAAGIAAESLAWDAARLKQEIDTTLHTCHSFGMGV